MSESKKRVYILVCFLNFLKYKLKEKLFFHTLLRYAERVTQENNVCRLMYPWTPEVYFKTRLLTDLLPKGSIAGEYTMRNQAYQLKVSVMVIIISNRQTPQYTVPSATISRSIWLSMTMAKAAPFTQVILVHMVQKDLGVLCHQTSLEKQPSH